MPTSAYSPLLTGMGPWGKNGWRPTSTVSRIFHPPPLFHPHTYAILSVEEMLRPPRAEKGWFHAESEM